VKQVGQAGSNRPCGALVPQGIKLQVEFDPPVQEQTGGSAEAILVCYGGSDRSFGLWVGEAEVSPC
jgi:hypothetical protein